MAKQQEPFSCLITKHWLDLATRLSTGKSTVLDGHSLTIPAVVLAARYGGTITLDEAALPAIQRNSEVLKDLVKRNVSIYGVNTGFGGSADVRTTDVIGLQTALLRMLQFGIVSNQDLGQFDRALSKTQDISALLQRTALPVQSGRLNHDMPLAWIRGSMAVRVNSLCQGASGIEPVTVQAMANLLTANIVPQVPLRGSISASGDLSPLSYIAGVLEGNSAVKAYKDGHLLPADEALSAAKLRPVKFGAKEALAIVNGTAVSAAVGSLAVHETLQLAALAQILTAMSVEAMSGSVQSFDPFIAKLRPHIGQVDSARSIRGFLKDTKLTCSDRAFTDFGTLRQDRYSIRTSTQWIGPALEDLHLAYVQLSTEINSVTDNPLIDTERREALGGGNFQARAVSSAMEKTRQACQVIGKMLFAQCTEMINPATNNGLPPNLVGDEPSESFLFKGVDIMIASLSSELGFLSTPVNYIEHAEMGNQAINSMALVSARYTLDAADVLGQLVSAHLGAACQALDLRAMQQEFLKKLRPAFDSAFGARAGVATENLWYEYRKVLDTKSNVDSGFRMVEAAKSLQTHLIDIISAQNSRVSLEDLKEMTESFGKAALLVYQQSRDQYLAKPDATPYLGSGSKAIYTFIRHRVGVPFATEAGLKDAKLAYGTAVQSPIYSAIKSGALWPVIIECFQDADRADAPRARL